MSPPRALLVCVLLALIVSSASCDDVSHTFKRGEPVTVWMNRIGPYHNPQETYSYYSLPFCRPSKALRSRTDSLGSMLQGNDLSDSGIELNFQQDVQKSVLCSLAVTEGVAEELVKVVQEHYWYQMYIDELPLWGMIGELMVKEGKPGKGGESETAFLYTHKSFSISYNGDRIIEVNMTSGSPKPIALGSVLQMTYSVQWAPTAKSYENRFERYLETSFFEHQNHWFYIANSFILVLFLCGVVSLIMIHTLNKDYDRYMNEEDDIELASVIEEGGWKQVSGDVFRAPPHLGYLAALLGTGWQLMVLAAGVIISMMLGDFYEDRGALVSTFLFCYALTSFVAGFASGRFYKQQGGTRWKPVVGLTALLLPSVYFVVLVIINFIASLYGSLAALGTGTVVRIVALFLFASCPMVLLGALAGRALSSQVEVPFAPVQMHVQTDFLDRPERVWYSRPWVLALSAGFLPFGSIFIELYFIFTSFWNYKFYYVYELMFAVFLILIIVTVCTAVVSTYSLLNAEDPRWWWTSFASGAATAVYVMLYCVYYYFAKTQMTGLLQTSIYFGYCLLGSVGLAVLGGTAGFCGASFFVHTIYTNIKHE